MSELFRRIGVEIPIVQAPMAGVSTPAMAAAVTNAGALGSVALGAIDAAAAARAIEAARRRTDGPFAVNVFCHRPAMHDRAREQAWLVALKPAFARFGAVPPDAIEEIYTSFVADRAMQELLLDIKPAALSFHFGLPEQSVIARLKAQGVLLFATATNLHEAERAQAAGVDAVVAQGYEAGGHRGVFDPDAPDAQLGVFALTRLLAKSIALPVIAAGGIMDGAGIAAAQTLGAAGAQLGTAFIACPESSADAAHRAGLTAPRGAQTVMTRVFSGRPARGLPNAMTELEHGALAGMDVPDYPIAYDANKKLAAAAGTGFAAQWAGQGAPLARALPAAELVAALRDEARAASRRADRRG